MNRINPDIIVMSRLAWIMFPAPSSPGSRISMARLSTQMSWTALAVLSRSSTTRMGDIVSMEVRLAMRHVRPSTRMLVIIHHCFV